MRKKLLVLTIATGVLVGGVGVAVADPNLPNVPAHRHFVQTPSGGLVQIGPRLCDDPTNPHTQHAFNQFHFNVHASATSPTTPVTSLGPQHGAPGLHDGPGAADLMIRACSFTG